MGKRAEGEAKSEEAVKSQIAIQCAKAALMLSSLKSSPVIDDHRQETEVLKKEVADLKVQLARERVMNKRIKLCGLSELLLHLMVLLSLSTFFLLLAFRSISN